MFSRQTSRRAAWWAATTLTLIPMSVNTHAQSADSPLSSVNTDVPVKEVVLFSSGVGYFQHEGTVHGDASTELRFKTAQINDILKSLVLNDLDGGHVGVVTYPSQDPLEKTLASFQVDIGDNPGQGALLNKLRGARITLGYGAETLTGTVLGVEEREVPGGKEGSDPLKLEFLNLVTNAGIRSLPLAKVDHFQLEDRGLQEELNRALAAVAGARDQDKKPVDIRFNGQGERRVRLGYVVETPIWKASYRLVLPDKAAKDTQGILQGWAIVENQTDNDWKDVRLSLVSGRPISFIQDLYQPLYVPRPTVVPELYSSLRPQAYQAGQQVNEAAAVDAPSSQKRTRAVIAPGSPSPALPVPSFMYDQEMGISESVQPLSDTSKVGALFQYTVADVSLARQKSAMIPIINDPIELEKLSIYNPSVQATYPLNGARIKNTTEDKKHLLQGPVTVFDGGRYAGDARLDDVPPGQTRLLSYGLDLEMNVLVKDPQDKQAVQTGKIVRGVLQVTRKFVSAREYNVENKGEEEKTLLIKHPFRAGWKLVDPPAPVEATDQLYRFQQPVAAGKTARVTVREEDVRTQSVALLRANLGDVQSYSQTGEIPEAVRAALLKVAARKQALAETQRQINDKEAQIKDLSGDQGRIRDNLKAVDRASAYATRLLKKLDDQESLLEKLRADTDALRDKLNGQNKDLSDSLDSLSVG